MSTVWLVGPAHLGFAKVEERGALKELAMELELELELGNAVAAS